MFSEIKNDILAKWKNGDAYIRLIIIIVGSFLALLIPSVVASIFYSADAYHSFVLRYLCLPTKPIDLLFRPWTIVTHIFIHFEPMHLISNVLMLNFAGSLLHSRVTNQIFYRVFFLSGLAGIALLISGENIFNLFSTLQLNSIAFGCSACVMGVLVCATVLNPHLVINLFLAGPVKLMYITGFLVVLDLVYLYSTNSGGHIAHIGGAAFGWWYGMNVRKAVYPGAWVDTVLGIFNRERKPKMKVTYKRPISDEEYNAQKKANQAEIDAILDKISRSGYDSLSAKEKQTLFKASNQK